MCRKRIFYLVLFYRIITFHYVFRPTADNLSELDRLSCKWNIEPCRAQIPLEEQTRALDLLARDLLSVPLADPYAPDLALACLLGPRTVPYGPEGYGATWQCVSCDDRDRGCPQEHSRGDMWENEVCALYCGPRTRPRRERATATHRTHLTVTPSNVFSSTIATSASRTIARPKKSSAVFATSTGPKVTHPSLIHPPDVRNVSNTTRSTNNLTYKSDSMHDAQRVTPIDTLHSRTIEGGRLLTQSLLWKLFPWVASATVTLVLLLTIGLVCCFCSGKDGSRPIDGAVRDREPTSGGGHQLLPDSNTRLLQLSLARQVEFHLVSVDTTGKKKLEGIVLRPNESTGNSTGSSEAVQLEHDGEDSFVTESSFSEAPS